MAPLRGWLPLLLSALLAGCASRGPVDLASVYAPRPSDAPIVWPVPPDTPRIQYLRSFSRPEDLGVGKSRFRKVVEFFTGRTERRLQQPYGLAVDSAGRIYVADQAAKGVHVFDPRRSEYRLFRETAGGEFRTPVGVAVDAEGRIYVSDAEIPAVILLDPRGREWGRITDIQRPAGIAVNPVDDLLYVVDVLGHEVRVYGRDGSFQRAFGGRGTDPGQFNFPTNITVDAGGRLYVTDSMNFRVQVFQPDGTLVGRFGQAGDEYGEFARPKGIGVDNKGHIYVVEGLYDAVNVYDREGRHLLTFGQPGAGRGQFWLATGITVDDHNRIFVADSFNGRIQVFEYLERDR